MDNNITDLHDDELYRMQAALKLSAANGAPSGDIVAIDREIALREQQRAYLPAYKLSVYFSAPSTGPWSTVHSIAQRIKFPFTVHRTLGAWEGAIEQSCVLDFVFNPRENDYPTTVQEIIGLAHELRQVYNQDSVLVTYQGDGMRQWWVTKKNGKAFEEVKK